MEEGMEHPVGVAILGCGYWGGNYVRVFGELAGARVCVVCDQRPERLTEIRRRFPGIETTTSAEAALQMDGVTAAVVCTQTTQHFELARRCLETGRHTLIEKPLTTTVAQGEQLVALAAAQHLTLMVGHTFLYNSGVAKVKEYLTQGRLNHVYYLYSRRTNLGPIRQDVDAFWDLATHDISIYNHLLEAEPESVSAVGIKVLRNDHADVGFASLRYPNGVVGHIHVSWVDPNKVRELVVVGDNMRIVFNDMNPQEQVRVFEKGVAVADSTVHVGEYLLGFRDGDIISPKVELGEPLKRQCQHFLDCLLLGRAPRSGGAEGLAVVRTLEAINQSQAQDGAPVKVNGRAAGEPAVPAAQLSLAH